MIRVTAISDAGVVHHARFSEGMETRTATRQKEHFGRFSDGQERGPGLAREHIGRFSVGLEARGNTLQKEHRGRFSDGQTALELLGRAA